MYVCRSEKDLLLGICVERRGREAAAVYIKIHWFRATDDTLMECRCTMYSDGNDCIA